MKRSVVLALAVLATGCAGAHRGAPVPAGPATPNDAIAGAKATIEQWRQAYEVRSAETLAKLYAHDGDVLIVQEGTAKVGWNEVNPTLVDRVGHASAIHVRLKDVRITSLAPTAASAVATMSRETSNGATTVTENGTLTLVLREDPEGWVITSEHYSYKR